MPIFKRILVRRRLLRQIEASIPRLMAIAVAWTNERELAREIVQEALAIGCSKVGQLRDEQALENWLISILANCHHAHHRKTYPTVDLESVELISPQQIDHDVETARISIHIRKAMGQLTDRQRKVLTLVDMEGMSYIEVAQVLEIPVGTVMSRVCRARNRLKTLVEAILNNQPVEATHSIRRIK